MLPAERRSRLAAARRMRLLRRVTPVMVVVAAATPYLLHHTELLDGHRLGVSLLIVGAAAAVALVPLWLSRRRERQLPLVLAVERGSAELRPVEGGDLDFCAALHAEQLPHGFFAELGHRFLRAYLATFVDAPHAVALLAAVRGAPVGFVVGILRPEGHAGWVVRHRGVRLALLGGIGLAARPRLAFRFVRTRISRYARVWARRRGDVPTPTPPTGQPAVLSHVAVAPGANGLGIGTQLVDAFVDAARAAGCSRVELVTLADDAGAAGFYRRLGWIESSTHRDFDGHTTIVFSLPLTADAQQAAPR